MNEKKKQNQTNQNCVISQLCLIGLESDGPIVTNDSRVFGGILQQRHRDVDQTAELFLKLLLVQYKK